LILNNKSQIYHHLAQSAVRLAFFLLPAYQASEGLHDFILKKINKHNLEMVLDNNYYVFLLAIG